MEAPLTSSGQTPALADAAKAISDLDLLIRALLTSLPSAKPWQRQGHLQLEDCARLLQVLRMTISMERRSEEVQQAGRDLLIALRRSNASVSTGRAGAGTKQAFELALNLGQRVASQLEAVA